MGFFIQSPNYYVPSIQSRITTRRVYKAPITTRRAFQGVKTKRGFFFRTCYVLPGERGGGSVASISRLLSRVFLGCVFLRLMCLGFF